MKRPEEFGYEEYLSPFTWRYGSAEMRELFSESNRRKRWRRAWLALAQAEKESGLVTPDELKDIREKSQEVNIAKSHAIEREMKHDLMAELLTFADQAKIGGGKLHLGATSADIEDNSDVLAYQTAVGLILDLLSGCLAAARKQILRYKGLACMGWTHLQPAEPTTVGYRLAGYAQDLAMDVRILEFLAEDFLLGKGLKGAVGTSASFVALTGSSKEADRLESSFMKQLGLEGYAVAGQTYPRKADYLLLAGLASVAQSCHKFGLDLRILQSPGIGEMSEGFGKRQVGSSAMPFKRNPVRAERMCSLARFVSALPAVGFHNAASSILERTLDDSAARRIVLPEAFLAAEECLTIYRGLMEGLQVNERGVRRNLEIYGPFAGTEPLMAELVKRGADRQRAHETIRKLSMLAWNDIENGRPNTLVERLGREKAVSSKIKGEEIAALMNPQRHTGEAEERCEKFVKSIEPILTKRRPKPSETSGF